VNKLSIIIAALCCGCVATSGHVDKTEKMNFEFFKFFSQGKPETQPLLRDYKEHIDEGSGVKIDPELASTGLDLLFPGLGGIATLAMSLYARKKHVETREVTNVAVNAAKECDPNKALSMLSNNPKVKHYNG